MIRQDKQCVYCGGSIPRGHNYHSKKHCGRDCYNAAKRLSPRTADRFFWPKVERSEGCWLWKGRKDKAGYGRYDRKGEYVYAHRISWLFINGAIPEGMEVAHSCDVRACCNPAHLFLATHAENMADCTAKGRQTRGPMNMHAKLSEAQAKEIIRDFRVFGPRKTNVRELAARYGVSENTAYLVGTGRTWKYLHASPSGDSQL